MKKLQLKKEVIEKLDNDQSKMVKGGATDASCMVCGTIGECDDTKITGFIWCGESPKTEQPTQKDTVCKTCDPCLAM